MTLLGSGLLVTKLGRLSDVAARDPHLDHPLDAVAVVVESLLLADATGIVERELRRQELQQVARPNEDFFRQTVLNVLGYFRRKGVICGSNLSLTRAVFKDADASLAKNIERNITSSVFPKQTDKVLDIYIDKLLKGEF